MVDHSDIRCTSPSIAFLFARLGGLLDSSSDPLGVPPFRSSYQYPRIRDFVVGPNGLDLALGDIYPLLHKYLSWFKSIHGDLRRENMGSVVRSSGSEWGSSSNVGVDGAGTNTTTSMPIFVPSSSNPHVPSAPRSFHALKEKCTLKAEVFDRFRDRFQFPNRQGLVFLGRVRRLVPLPMVKSAFMRQRSCVVSDSPSIHSLWNSLIT